MKEVMERKMEGKRGRGRKRIGMIDELMENKQYGDLKRRAEDRQGWRVWLPGTCRVAEHSRRRSKVETVDTIYVWCLRSAVCTTCIHFTLSQFLIHKTT